MSFKFGEISVASKDFHSKYQVTDNINLEKITVSEGSSANKHGMRYTIGYEDRAWKDYSVVHQNTKESQLIWCISIQLELPLEDGALMSAKTRHRLSNT